MARTADAFSFGAMVADSGVRRGLTAILTELERAGRHGFTQAELDRARSDYLRSIEQAYAERDKTESDAFTGEYVSNFLTGEGIPGIGYEYHPGQSGHARHHGGRARLAGARMAQRQRPGHPGQHSREESRRGSQSPADLLGLFASVNQSDIAAYQETVSDGRAGGDSSRPGRIVARTAGYVLHTIEWTLGNGARVILKPTDFKDDELLFQGASPGGLSLAPDSILTSARFAAQIVDLSGAGSFSVVDLQKKLAGKAVNISPYLRAYEQGLGGQVSPARCRDDVPARLSLFHGAEARLQRGAGVSWQCPRRAREPEREPGSRVPGYPLGHALPAPSLEPADQLRDG